MGYPRYPCREFAVVGVPSLLDGQDGLYKRLLEDVVCHILVFDDAHYVTEHSVFVPFQQCVESVVAAFSVSFDQSVVSHAYVVYHYSLFCFFVRVDFGYRRWCFMMCLGCMIYF